jgi:hypothetical protein
MRYRIRPKEQFRLVPNLAIETFRPSDGARWLTEARNLVVDDGIGLVRDLLGGTGHRPSHIGLGTGVTAPAAGDTAIETEQYRDVITRRDQLAAGIDFQLFLGLNEGNGFTYTEAGLLETGIQNDAPGDPAILVARATFTGVVKNNTVELTLTWTIGIAAV